MIRKKIQKTHRAYRSRKRNASINHHHLSKCENDARLMKWIAFILFLLILDFSLIMDAIDNIFAHYKTVANQKLKALPPPRF